MWVWAFTHPLHVHIGVFPFICLCTCACYQSVVCNWRRMSPVQLQSRCHSLWDKTVLTNQRRALPQAQPTIVHPCMCAEYRSVFMLIVCTVCMFTSETVNTVYVIECVGLCVKYVDEMMSRWRKTTLCWWWETSEARITTLSTIPERLSASTPRAETLLVHSAEVFEVMSTHRTTVTVTGLLHY